ncbi:MAG: hypothetical protein KY437_07170 [Actinobacteria bacterium]|nr:hypothetical protein [Actinomycetota bacterium]
MRAGRTFPSHRAADRRCVVTFPWAGTALLISGATLNLVDLQGWRRSQAAGFRALLAS